MTLFTEECLYMRAHLDYVRKEGAIEHMPDVQSDWGKHARVLCTIPRVWALCGLQDGKMGHAVA